MSVKNAFTEDFEGNAIKKSSEKLCVQNASKCVAVRIACN
jgi:hypothetical protein